MEKPPDSSSRTGSVAVDPDEEVLEVETELHDA